MVAPASDANMIRAHDNFGRELFITRQQWLDSVLLGNIEKAWDAPDQLASLVISGLRDRFFPEMVKPAERLREMDSDSEQGAVLLGIAYMEVGRLDDAERTLQQFTQKHGERGVVTTNLAKVYDKQGNASRALDTLWRALELDPNQDNGLAWYLAIERDKGGDTGFEEGLHLQTQAQTRVLVPWIVKPQQGFVLSSWRWDDADAAKYATASGPVPYVVVSHVKSTVEPWQITMRLIRTADAACLDQWNDLFSTTMPSDSLRQLGCSLVMAIQQKLGIQPLAGKSAYTVPRDHGFADYLLRLDQLLATRCDTMEGVSANSFSGEHEAIDGALRLCADHPTNTTVRLLLVRLLSYLKTDRPQLVVQYGSKIRELQRQYPLEEPARGSPADGRRGAGDMIRNEPWNGHQPSRRQRSQLNRHRASPAAMQTPPTAANQAPSGTGSTGASNRIDDTCAGGIIAPPLRAVSCLSESASMPMASNSLAYRAGNATRPRSLASSRTVANIGSRGGSIAAS
jgi:tetratricopeptide (TPR) repeat protein